MLEQNKARAKQQQIVCLELRAIIINIYTNRPIFVATSNWFIEHKGVKQHIMFTN